MTQESLRALEMSVEILQPGRAKLIDSVPVREELAGGAVWEGVVHVFRLEGNPRATRAYGWWSPAAGGERRFTVALHRWKVTSPVEAVREAIGPSFRITKDK
jgi:hypothetical protein